MSYFGRFQAAGVDQIRRAFKALDAEGKGELSVDEVKKYFGKQGGNSIGSNYASWLGSEHSVMLLCNLFMAKIISC